MAYDVIVKGGRVVDGTGDPWFRADVGVRDGEIRAIGDLATDASCLVSSSERDSRRSRFQERERSQL